LAKSASGLQVRRVSRIILHVGYQKCGSKSIQEFCKINLPYLQAKGITTLQSTKIKKVDTALMAYAGLPSRIRQMRERFDLPDASDAEVYSAIEESIIAEINACESETICLSYEGLLRLPEDQVARLVGFLKTLTKNLQVLAIVRRQDRQATSGYTTRLLNTRLSGHDLFHDQRGQFVGIDYYEALEHWAKQVRRRNLTVYAFEDLEDVAHTYATYLGLPHDEVEFPPRQNTSLPAYGQEVLRSFNETFSAEKLWAAHAVDIKYALRELLPKDGDGLRPAASAAAGYLENFRRANRRLLRKYLPEDTRYNDDLKPLPEEQVKVELEPGELSGWVGRAIPELNISDAEKDILLKSLKTDGD
tara:strand:+ start:31338 stop:32417 length:1080 start_codon:yes stop_codon:yes gene_type:complete